MKNRYGDEYEFKQLDENTATIVGDLKYWRYGGKEGQEHLDDSNLGFVDPSGGPFIQIGMKIFGRAITNIDATGEQIVFTLEAA